MVLSLKSNSKSTVLRELLLEKAKDFKVGQRLPTVKELMASHKVSQATVVESLDYLKQMGYIESTVGRGTFLKKPVVEEKHVSKVDMFFFGVEDNLCVPSFHSEWAVCLQQKLKDRAGMLHITVLPHSASWCDFVDAFDRLDCEAVILSAPSNVDIYKAVARRQIPFVNMFPNFNIAGMTNSVQIDNLAVAKLWVEHLKGLGHTKIAHIHSVDMEEYSRDHYQRFSYFYQEMAGAGLLVDPANVIHGGFRPEGAYEATKKLLKNGSEFTAVICSDDNASGVYQALEEAGLSIPGDVSVIGIDGRKDVDLVPSLTTLSQTPDSFADLVIEKFDDMFRYNKCHFENILTEPMLVAKASTGPVRN